MIYTEQNPRPRSTQELVARLTAGTLSCEWCGAPATTVLMHQAEIGLIACEPCAAIARNYYEAECTHTICIPVPTSEILGIEGKESSC